MLRNIRENTHKHSHRWVYCSQLACRRGGCGLQVVVLFPFMPVVPGGPHTVGLVEGERHRHTGEVAP